MNKMTSIQSIFRSSSIGSNNNKYYMKCLSQYGWIQIQECCLKQNYNRTNSQQMKQQHHRQLSTSKRQPCILLSSSSFSFSSNKVATTNPMASYKSSYHYSQQQQKQMQKRRMYSSSTSSLSSKYNWKDPFLIRDTLLTSEERTIQDMVSKFCNEELLPNIVLANRHEIYCNHVMMKQFGSLGLLGCTLPTQYGGSNLGYVSYGIIAHEIEKIDSSYRSAISVQSSLVMYPIYQYASSDAIRQKYLPKLGSGEYIGCFGLTEPNHGSDPGSMETKAVYDAGTNEYILNGSKNWITNSPIADVFVVWAKNNDGIIKGYIVDKDTPGLTTPKINGKFSLRASITGMIFLDDVRIPVENQLNVFGLKGPFSCLNYARYGISWGVLGAAESCMHIARDYTMNRIQFNKPLAANQLIQKKLTEMSTEININKLNCIQVGRLLENDNSAPEMISMIKRNNCMKALHIVREARDMLGGNGICDEYHIIRHLCNLEAVNTYEGTSDIHALILGRAITDGISAF